MGIDEEMLFANVCRGSGTVIPDGKDTSSLSETRLLLNTTDSLLKDGGNLSGGGLGLSGVGTDLLGGTSQGTGGSRADLFATENLLTTAHSTQDA